MRPATCGERALAESLVPPWPMGLAVKTESLSAKGTLGLWLMEEGGRLLERRWP